MNGIVTAESMLAHTEKWLMQWADAAAKGEVVNERAMDDGGWLVSTRWPTRDDYRAHAKDLWALEAMAYHDRLARA